MNSGDLRVGLAQVNPTVGDLAGNRALILEYAKRAAVEGVNLLLFPEMVLTGYPIEDLALRPSFQQAVAESLQEIAVALKDEGAGDLAVVIGYLGRSSTASIELGTPAGAPQNSLAIIYQGGIRAHYSKCHLPNYGVFDEYRYFVPGDKGLIARICGIDIAFAICEDLWRFDSVIKGYQVQQPGALMVINGSPYEQDKDDVRFSLCSQRARELDTTLAYVNMTGGQDELVFDGDSMVVDSSGELIARAPQFSDGLLIVDISAKLASAKEVDVVISEEPHLINEKRNPSVVARLDALEEVWQALVVGIRDYVNKNGFKSVITGLSGGIDSSVSMTLAVDALGPDRVFGVSLPSKYSSEHSQSDAYELAKRLGISIRTVEIEPMVNEFVSHLNLTGLAEENIQARVRGSALMALSNSEGHLVLANGNKSELAVGYSTIYGDAVGGYAPIKDVSKSMVWELAKWRNSRARELGEVEPIPTNSIEKAPSAELRPDQKDSDSLPEYDLLDRILDAYVEGDLGADRIAREGFDPVVVERVLRLVDAAEYKRRQYPPGPKVTSRAFGRDRRLPITNIWRESVTRP